MDEMSGLTSSAKRTLRGPGASTRPRLGALVAALAAWTALTVGFSTAASPQTSDEVGFAATNFEPAPTQYSGVLNFERPGVLGHLTPAAGLFFHAADDPVQLASPIDGEVRDRLVDEQYTVEAGFALGLFDRLELGVAVPVVAQTGASLGRLGSSGSVGGVGPGDVRATVKLAILRAARTGGFGLAASGVVHAPSGDQSQFTSDGRVRGTPRLSMGWRSGDVRLIGNVGYEFGPSIRVRNYEAEGTIPWGVGGGIALPIDRLEVVGTLSGSNSTGGASGDAADPLELLGGLRADLPGGFRLQAGGGAGVSDGVGAPDFRVFTSLHWARVGEDSDGDGMLDRNDACPREPEDFDDYEDSDGCPDEDNDGDGIVDREDDCPDTPGPEENDGCPRSDRDGDGIYDSEDDCPDEPEDFDGFEDEDGCPDPDNDGDGIPDEDDECPDEPETRNGIADEDGCPDESKAEVVEDKIEISEKIYFETNKAVLKERSFDVLQDVAQILTKYDDITTVRIEGHTDARGRKEYNRRLSLERARAVEEYLVEHGASADQLEPVGRGQTEPIASNETEEGRAKNRRVEFVITEFAGEEVEEGEEVLEERSDPEGSEGRSEGESSGAEDAE